MTTNPPCADTRWLSAFHAQMLRFASVQLGNAQTAQDVVQESLAAALAERGAPCDSAGYKRWVFGILKHKIVDQIRRQSRLVALADLAGGDDEAGVLDACFGADGEWHPYTRPAAWAAPDESMASKQFWHVFDTCLARLPAHSARVFMMREYLGFESSEICQRLAMTVSALHVTLHRARLRLRSCLEMRWFAREARSDDHM
ncbi:hypothetical protein CAL11_17810 [Bordetella genomosp. 6]|nr:hypothetical protein BBB44_06115 [Bordetella bronchiseptica]ARP77869.1 hypothetical protein CAL11_17810 [Bordetella genomosp. 6]AZW43137.1 RNA polymerase subunit sigma [Bordetella bronchiseptica]